MRIRQVRAVDANTDIELQCDLLGHASSMRALFAAAAELEDNDDELLPVSCSVISVADAVFDPGTTRPGLTVTLRVYAEPKDALAALSTSQYLPTLKALAETKALEDGAQPWPGLPL